MSTIPPRFANVQAATAMENRIKALDLGVKIESDLRQRSEGQECITEYTVSIKITNPKTGNGVVRNILPDASEEGVLMSRFGDRPIASSPRPRGRLSMSASVSPMLC